MNHDEKLAVEALRRALWMLRHHELNSDGSPCWCFGSEVLPHSEDCQRARDAMARYYRLTPSKKASRRTGFSPMVDGIDYDSSEQ